MQRISFVLNVKDGQQDEYIRRHQEVWPEVLNDLQHAGIHNMSIFMHGLQMFLYMEADNYAEAIRILGDSPESLRWEEYMAPIMEGEAEAAYDPENAYPDGLPEVFHWETSPED